MKRRDGTVLWEQAAMKRRGLTAPAIDGDALVVGDYQGYIHWLDKATGELVAREKSDGERISNSAITDDAGHTFVQTDSGKLVAFRTKANERRKPQSVEPVTPDTATPPAPPSS